jgi:hypothetical protein
MGENSNVSPSSIVIPSSIASWTYLISDILSLVCILFVLYYLLFDRTRRHAFNNHVIIILLFMGLIYELTTVPWFLYRLRYDSPWIQNPTFYLFSFFFDYGLFVSQIILFSWATIERHILIFHDQWVSTKKKRLFIHYLPIVTIIIYCFIYYSLITFGPFCKSSFEEFLAMDIYTPCLFDIPILATWELIGHEGVPTFIIVIFSISLIVCVIKQKRTMNQPIQWRKHRKMTIQMLSISSLYFILNAPGTIIHLGSQYGLPQSVTVISFVYIYYFFEPISYFYFHLYVVYHYLNFEENSKVYYVRGNEIELLNRTKISTYRSSSMQKLVDINQQKDK